MTKGMTTLFILCLLLAPSSIRPEPPSYTYTVYDLACPETEWDTTYTTDTPPGAFFPAGAVVFRASGMRPGDVTGDGNITTPDIIALVMAIYKNDTTAIAWPDSAEYWVAVWQDSTSARIVYVHRESEEP